MNAMTFFRFLAPAALTLALSACGGGSGGSSPSGVPGVPAVIPSSPPVVQTAVVGTVTTIAAAPTAATYHVGFDPTSGHYLVPGLGGGYTTITEYDQAWNVVRVDNLPTVISGLIYDPALGLFVASTSSTLMRYDQRTHAAGWFTGIGSGFADGPPASASFSGISDMTIDPAGTIYVADGNRVRKVDASGNVTTLALSGTPPVRLTGLTYDAADGNLYFTDAGALTVGRIAPSGSVTTLSGACDIIAVFGPSCIPQDLQGPAAVSRFAYPSGIAYDPDDASLYVSDLLANRIVKMDTAGNTQAFAGYGFPGKSIDGVGQAAFMDAPLTLSYFPATGMFVEIEGYTPRALRTIVGRGPAAPVYQPPVTEFHNPQLVSRTLGVVRGSDGNLYFDEPVYNTVGRLTPAGVFTHIALPGGFRSPRSLVAGADGNVWMIVTFAPSAGGMPTDYLAKMTPGGNFTTYTDFPANSPTAVYTNIANGPDGNIWFTAWTNTATMGGRLGSVTPGGVFTSFVVQAAGVTPAPGFVASGADGNLWVTMSAKNISVFSTAGALLNSYALPAGTSITGIGLGPDGRIWLPGESGVLAVDRTGTMTSYPLPCSGLSGGGTGNCTMYGSNPVGGPDGNVYFGFDGSIARFTPGGASKLLPMPSWHSSVGSLAVGSDGNLWFADYFANTVGKIAPF